MPFFSTGDEPTDKNLQRLDHLANDACDGNADRMHNWLSAVIQSKALLPHAAANHFTGFYHIGNQHYQMGTDARRKKWSELVNELRSHVNAAYGDPRLRRDGPFGPPDVSDRPETLGERVSELARRLGKAGAGTSEFNRILTEIESVAVGAVGSDIRQLKELLSRKRRGQDHDYWVARHITHIATVANQQHHLPAR
jgi:hypothetical protein